MELEIGVFAAGFLVGGIFGCLMTAREFKKALEKAGKL